MQEELHQHVVDKTQQLYKIRFKKKNSCTKYKLESCPNGQHEARTKVEDERRREFQMSLSEKPNGGKNKGKMVPEGWLGMGEADSHRG